MNQPPTPIDFFQQLTAIVHALGALEGKMKALEDVKESIEGLREEFRPVAETVVKHGEQIEQLHRSLYGDARVMLSPSIRKDIDRHETEIVELRDLVKMLVEDGKERNESLKRIEVRLEAVKPWVSISQAGGTLKNLLFDHWFKLASGAIATAIAGLVYNYLQSRGIVP